MTDIRETIARLRELYKKSMPGKWTRMGKWISPNPGVRLDTAVSDCFSDADAMFIAEAHNAMPALLAYIEKLEKELYTANYEFSKFDSRFG